MTKIEILDFIVDYYKTHPRALDHSGVACTYFNKENGARCAHSICIEDNVLEDMVSRVGVDPKTPFSLGSSAYTVIKFFGDEMHKPEFRGHKPKFWGEVQWLHDKESNWLKTAEGNELSVEGLLFLRRLKELYKDN